jgi:putative cell wall-binding protein
MFLDATAARARRARAAVVASAVVAALVVAAPAHAAEELEPAATGGTLFGSVALLVDPLQSPVPVSSGRVQFYAASTSDPYQLMYQTTIEPDGSFAIDGVEEGQYRIAFTSTMGSPYVRVREWFQDHGSFFDADPFVVIAGEPYDFGTVIVNGRQIDRTRLSGADRFATTAAVAERGWPDGGGGTVFVVNGLNFPDALSAGAATRNGVLLTVRTDDIPTATAEQLTRIQPGRIVVVGGTGVVSNAVLTQLRGYVADPLDPNSVVRIAGSSRYETSRAVLTSAFGFNSAPAEVFLATGRNFPDALSAVPAAISMGAAVLLVDGSAGSLDSATAALLQTLGVPVTIIGGTGAVSAGIEAQVAGIVGVGATSRVSGADRFATSTAIVQRYFGEADYAFLANGFGFADALAAGPVAGRWLSPVYLVRQECIPQSVANDIVSVYANEMIAVGGTGVVSANTLQGVGCS